MLTHNKLAWRSLNFWIAPTRHTNSFYLHLVSSFTLDAVSSDWYPFHLLFCNITRLGTWQLLSFRVILLAGHPHMVVSPDILRCSWSLLWQWLCFQCWKFWKWICLLWTKISCRCAKKSFCAGNENIIATSVRTFGVKAVLTLVTSVRSELNALLLELKIFSISQFFPPRSENLSGLLTS